MQLLHAGYIGWPTLQVGFDGHCSDEYAPQSLQRRQ